MLDRDCDGGSGISPDEYLDNLSLTLQTPPAVTPEPSSLLLAGTGVLALSGMLRRRFA